jgi:glycosyltransferase involved in cell wall biosynthesis
MFSANPRIGVVSWDFDPPIGGMGVHARTLVSGLRAQGMDVRVLSRKDLPSFPGRNVVFSLLLSAILPQWLRREKIDVLHVHVGPGGVFLLRDPGAPVLVTANHTFAQQSTLPGQRWKRIFLPFERWTYRIATSVVCISADTERTVVGAYGIEPSRVTIVPCGIDLAPFIASDVPLSERKRSVVFVGRPDIRKGFDLLLDAWKKIHVELSDPILDIVGFMGPDTPGIRYHGHVTDEALRSLVSHARVLAFPSRIEGFGLAAAEAIAAGTPVVAFDVDGVRGVVMDGVSGTLVSGGVDDFVDALRKLLTEDAYWQTLHEGCVGERQRFDGYTEVSSYKNLLSSIRYDT